MEVAENIQSTQFKKWNTRIKMKYGAK